MLEISEIYTAIFGFLHVEIAAFFKCFPYFDIDYRND